MTPCIAYRTDGRVCGVPARFLDRTRGGLVCVEHTPAGVCWACGRHRVVVGLLCHSCRAEAREEARSDEAMASVEEDTR